MLNYQLQCLNLSNSSGRYRLNLFFPTPSRIIRFIRGFLVCGGFFCLLVCLFCFGLFFSLFEGGGDCNFLKLIVMFQDGLNFALL